MGRRNHDCTESASGLLAHAEKAVTFDLMKSQFDFYLRLLPTAEARTRTYWGHAGACFTEQMENFGLPNPAEYGFKRPESYDRGVGI